jgi:2-polyprenyl-3-methyl-5-hydroxy-6-metoxy-1,4-benzoquinol methylase
VKFLDRVLQRWRITKARSFIRPGARILDIGSADGVLFQMLGRQISSGVGIDPALSVGQSVGAVQFITGCFPKDLPEMEPFDTITMLAVLEHFPMSEYAILTAGCRRHLKPDGRLVITVPSPKVDRILHWLAALYLIDGMSLEEHHQYNVDQTTQIFPAPDFRLVHRERFQLGLNNLFVFQHTGAQANH